MNKGKEMPIKDEKDIKGAEEGVFEDSGIGVDELDKIRDRTFNKEFKDLVDKIAHHSEESVSDDISSDESDDVLLKRLHELFYKAGSLTGVKNINYNFNPYVFKDNIQGSLIQNINRGFNKLSLGKFAILTFDFKKKCFEPALNYISDLAENNIIIGISEDLYQSIIASEYGIQLDQQYINDDIYLRKRFCFKEKYKKDDLLYFLSLKRSFYEFVDELNIREFDLLERPPLFPILMIQLSSDNKDDSPEKIYKTIKNSIIVQLVLYNIEVYRTVSEVKFERFDQLIVLLEFYFNLFSRDRKGNLIIVKFKQINEIYVIFVIKYLLLKLNRALSSKSVLSHFFRDRLFIFTDRSEVKTILQIVREFDDQFDFLHFKQLVLKKDMNFIDFISEYVVP